MPHSFVSDGVRITTDCAATPLRVTYDHLVFSATHGAVVPARQLREGDEVFGDVAETRRCRVLGTKHETRQPYMGLNCRESVVMCNGVKVSTFEHRHWLPSLWMRHVPAVLGLARASRLGELLSNLYHAVGGQ